MKIEKTKKKIYLASPWFNNEQLEREHRVKSKLRELGFDVFSPREETICPPNANEFTRNMAFVGNINAIFECDILFAITDGKDIGTIWEAGYAYGLNEFRLYRLELAKSLAKHNIELDARFCEKQIIIYYCETLNGGQFNLMLAQSGDIILTSFNELYSLNDLLMSEGKKQYVGNIE